MKREWKPGDVARTIAGGTVARTAQHRWILLDDGHPIDWEDDSRIARPLVVIDPEDREQVERLALAYCWTWTENPEPEQSAVRVAANQLQAALREFANPTPKPDEPQGLGAVVEDADGRRWVRITPRIADFHWLRADDVNASRPWRTIAAAKVLSEGVTP